MSRLFTDTSFLRDVLGLALAAHVVAAAARRTGLSSAATALVSVACFVVTATVLLYAGTAWFVLPTPDTCLDRARSAAGRLGRGQRQPGADRSDAGPGPGLRGGDGLLRLRGRHGRAAAPVPRGGRIRSGGQRVPGYQPAAVGTGDAAILHGVLACGAMGAVMVLLRLAQAAGRGLESSPGRTEAWPPWPGRPPWRWYWRWRSERSPVPALPGARAEPWVDLESFEFTDAAPWVEVPPPEPEPWADLAPAPAAGTASAEDPGDGPRVLVSPLVQVRSRLVRSVRRGTLHRRRARGSAPVLEAYVPR